MSTIKLIWFPIETAPVPTSDDGWDNWSEAPYVLVYDPEVGVRAAAADPYHEYPEGTHKPPIVRTFTWWTGSPYDSDDLRPTHWMPLPEPPKVTDEQ